MQRGPELMEVCELMHRVEELSEAEHARVCELMGTVGATVGLNRPWRINDAGAGPRLTYFRVFEERMPAALNYRELDTVQDEFDGRLIDDLPEARYLGRLVQEMGTVHGQRAAASW